MGSNFTFLRARQVELEKELAELKKQKEEVVVFQSSTDAYQDPQLKSWVMIMQTSMQIIGLRKTRLSSLVRQTSKTVVDKRLTMQSLQFVIGIVSCIRMMHDSKTTRLERSENSFKKIAKSKTYKKLCDNTVGSSGGQNQRND